MKGLGVEKIISLLFELLQRTSFLSLDVDLRYLKEPITLKFFGYNESTKSYEEVMPILDRGTIKLTGFDLYRTNSEQFESYLDGLRRVQVSPVEGSVMITQSASSHDYFLSGHGVFAFNIGHQAIVVITRPRKR